MLTKVPLNAMVTTLLIPKNGVQQIDSYKFSLLVVLREALYLTYESW